MANSNGSWDYTMEHSPSSRACLVCDCGCGHLLRAKCLKAPSSLCVGAYCACEGSRDHKGGLGFEVFKILPSRSHLGSACSALIVFMFAGAQLLQNGIMALRMLASQTQLRTRELHWSGQLFVLWQLTCAHAFRKATAPPEPIQPQLPELFQLQTFNS